ncbi:glycosyltransferase family 2 protein [Lutibacter citreus]|uniref:glycosyltransferase family 2 protein n=1 Tax=Lutibacter citreus TaxID=2138210 RepID=UPI000DBE848C|nr:glycosyltransferase family 2 protein [Lutibacter citreus]
MNTPMVSVVCFVYNHEKYIKDALDGFIMQKTSFPIEVIVHDDASTDSSALIIKDYEEKYPEIIKPIYQKINQYSIEKGIVSEICFNKAKGKYIAMCEGDDYWTDPLKLQKQVNALEVNPDIDICSHASIIFNDDKKENVGIVGNNGKKERVIPTKEVILKFGYVCPMQSIIIRNNRIDEFKTLSLSAYGGHGIMQVLWSHPNGVLYLPDIMGVYRSNSENSVTKNVLTNKKYYFKVLKKQIEKLKELDAHFNFIYAKEFFVKITEVNQKILSSRILSEYDKLNFIRDNKLKMSLIQTLNLLFKGWISKIKYNLLKIGIVKSIRNRNNVY